MSQCSPPGTSRFRLLQKAVLFLCLLTPSVWLVATVPPLWRDSDGYYQATLDPLLATYWGHGPAYCYLTKVPLFAGEALERLGATPKATLQKDEVVQLTDTGVWLLVIGQHLALAITAFYFITTISCFFPVRLGMSLIWASNGLFYTFAHCVGSETLSMILVVLLVTKGLRLFQARDPRWTAWYFFAITLSLLILSRHVNLWFILLLPLACILSWIQLRSFRWFAKNEREKFRLQHIASKDLRRLVITTAVGIISLAVANSSLLILTKKTPYHPHSRFGFTFFWRLHFLRTLTPESRKALLERVASHTDDIKTRQLIALLGQMYDDHKELEGPTLFLEKASWLLFAPGARNPWEKLDEALNRMAFAFLLPPTTEHLNASKKEFVAALKMPMTDISSFLFATTIHYFEHSDALRGCAELVTFRKTDPDTILQIPNRNLYFRLWRGLTYYHGLVIWFVSLLTFGLVARGSARRIGSFGIALVILGLVMIASTCLVGEFIPRYALPMWQLLFLSTCIFAAGTADQLVRIRIRRGRRPPRL